MRVAVVDIGTNSTRLLIADVDAEQRRGRGARAALAGDAPRATASTPAVALARTPSQRVLARAAEYRAEIDAARLRGEPGRAHLGRARRRQRRRVRRARARATSASTRACSAATKRRSSRSSARCPDGPAPDRADRRDRHRRRLHRVRRRASGARAGFHVSLPAGVVRMSERHIHSDPPASARSCRRSRSTSARRSLQGLPAEERAPVTRGHRRRRHRHVGRRHRPGARPLRPRARARLRAAARRPSNCCSRAWPTWTKRSAARSSGSTPTARRRSSPA